MMARYCVCERESAGVARGDVGLSKVREGVGQ